jgi:ComF family protein
LIESCDAMMNIRSALEQSRDATLALLYPTACRVCGAPVESWRDGVACAACWAELDAVRQAETACEKCGLPLAGLIETRCGQCETFAFRYARACGPYRGALRESVLWLKRHPQLPPRLRAWLREGFGMLPDAERIAAIVPVPLHASRLAERTFNQAEVLARAIAGETGLRVDAAAVLRAKATEMHRAGMSARERARSLERAFRIRAPRLVRDRDLLIVDDVMTTGSTTRELAQTLMEGGAQSVAVLTLARATDEFTN